MRFFSWTNGSCSLLQAREVTGSAEFFFLLSSIFLVNMATFLLFLKAASCSSVCKNCITYVLVIKQEIAERERGLEKACGAK